MNEYSTAALNGKIDAISLVLNQVLMQMTPVQAAHAAAVLAIEKAVVRKEADAETTEEEIDVKERVLGLYCDLLSTVAKHG